MGVPGLPSQHAHQASGGAKPCSRSYAGDGPGFGEEMPISFEAMMMALRVTGRNKILIDDSVNPIYRVMINSYTKNLSIDLEETNNDERSD
jgi:hypothetical protein